MRNWTSQAMHCCRDKALQDSEMTDSRSLLRNPTWLTSLVGTARWVCGDKLSCYSNRQPTVTLSLRYFVPITRSPQNERGNENGNDSVNGLLYRPDGYISHRGITTPCSNPQRKLRGINDIGGEAMVRAATHRQQWQGYRWVSYFTAAPAGPLINTRIMIYSDGTRHIGVLTQLINLGVDNSTSQQIDFG